MDIDFENIVLMAYFLADLREVYCSFKMMHSVGDRKEVNTCVANQTIDSEDYVFAPGPNTLLVKQFHISENKEVKFLPRLIGEKFLNLNELRVLNCGLTILRNWYFEDMLNVRYLYLAGNNIAFIESRALEPLISVKVLNLGFNLLERLDAKLFVTMERLQKLSLSNNKIKFLNPSIFKIPAGELSSIDLSGNVCINGNFGSENFEQMDVRIRANCVEHSIISEQ